MENKQHQAAVLEINEDYETSISSSCRTSMSSLDSNHDHTAPLELGLVIHALQTTLVEQELVVESPIDPPVEPSQKEETLIVKKREAKIITDYQSEIIPIKQLSTHSANLIVIDRIDSKSVKVNTLTPREQEKADEPIVKAIHHLFNNRFMKAKKLFEQQANIDPLHALGLGSMVFLKALMVR